MATSFLMITMPDKGGTDTFGPDQTRFFIFSIIYYSLQIIKGKIRTEKDGKAPPEQGPGERKAYASGAREIVNSY